MKLGFNFKRKKKTPKQSKSVIFRHRGFWSQIVWFTVMLIGCAAGAAYRSTVLFALSLVSAFLGMNEFGRLKYKTNLVICSTVAIAGSLAGVFSWLETASLFVMMCVTGGFVLYYRDTVRAMVPQLNEFFDVLSCCESDGEAAWKAHAILRRHLPSCRVFVLLSDGAGGLYLPEREDKPRQRLNRAGGIVWKCFASTLPYRRGMVSVERDLPLYREARSLIAAPMTAGGDTLGVIEIESRTAEFFSSDDKDRLAVFACLTGQAVYALRADEEMQNIKTESRRTTELLSTND